MRAQAAWRWMVVGALLLTSACARENSAGSPDRTALIAAANAIPQPAALPIPKPPAKITVNDVLGNGVVVVISKASQQMFVFADGAAWDSSPVSTGKKGKETPSGVFAILQKREFHRSNLYSNAPMPFMQRLTWDGIAIHAGALPGYPASHGCIRLPREFAARLYDLTGFTSTAVIVSDEALESEQAAWNIAKSTNTAIPIEASRLSKAPVWAMTGNVAPKGPLKSAPRPQLAKTPEAIPAGPTIQLAAAQSEAQAKAHWDRLVATTPKLADMKMHIEAATVNGQQYHRLRATSTDARSVCDELKAAGQACFFVT